MNYKDVALLNGSLDSMTDTLLKQKMLEQQGQYQQGQLAEAGRRTDAEQQHYDAEQAHYNAMQGRYDASAKKAEAAAQAKAIEDQKKQAAADQWKTRQAFDRQVELWGRNVKDGIMDPDQANTVATKLWQTIPEEKKALLADSPWAQYLASGTPPFKAPAAKAGFKTAPIANKEAWDAENAKADQAEQQGDAMEADAENLNQPAGESRMQQHLLAQKMRENADTFFKPGANKTDPTDTATVTEGHDAQGAPTRTVSRKVDPNKPQPLPSDQKDLVKGFLYQTSRGPARWDGMKFVKQ